jgi:predicted flap endonuclease-1-like 5' DNA nuclease
MPNAPRKATKIPLVRVNIRDDKGTNRPVFAPIYEAALLQSVWERVPGVTVEIQQLSATGPNGKPWPEDMRFMRSSMAKEEARLREKYRKHPVTKEPVFNILYGRGEFPDAFARAASGSWTPNEQAPEPVIDDSDLEDDEPPKAEVLKFPSAEDKPAAEAKPAAAPSGATTATAKGDDKASQIADLCRVKGLSVELAQAVIDSLGVTNVKDLAQIAPDELSQVAGIGPVTAQKIAASAQDLALQE